MSLEIHVGRASEETKLRKCIVITLTSIFNLASDKKTNNYEFLKSSIFNLASNKKTNNYEFLKSFTKKGHIYDKTLTPIQLRKAAFEFTRLVLTPSTQVMT
jgi:hypothetical protein